MGRLGNGGSRLRHWLCKDCETANERTRLKCLSCDKERSLVEVKPQDHFKIWHDLGFEEDYVLGVTMSEKEITKDWVKTNYTNGEYP